MRRLPLLGFTGGGAPYAKSPVRAPELHAGEPRAAAAGALEERAHGHVGLGHHPEAAPRGKVPGGVGPEGAEHLKVPQFG